MTAGVYAVQLDPMRGLQGEVVFNSVSAAMSRVALFALRSVQNLTFTTYGGRLSTDSGPVAVADQTVTLTPSTTNYIYADGSGLLHVVTSSPSGWPGPLTVGRALYELVVGANEITSGTCWNLGINSIGPQGPAGPTGPAGAELWLTRKRICQVPGYATSTFTSGASPGFEDRTNVAAVAPASRVADSSTFIGSVARVAWATGIGANVSSGIRLTNNLFTLGNAAGRGGFDIAFRFGAESTNTHLRMFVGLFDCSGGDPSVSVDPSALTNIIGVGCDESDTNFSFMVNDSSGTATKTALGANFPARGPPAPNNVYELRLWADANASLVNYSLTDAATGNNATGNASSNIPAGTTFLGWLIYVNNGATGSSGSIVSFMQVAASTRY